MHTPRVEVGHEADAARHLAGQSGGGVCVVEARIEASLRSLKPPTRPGPRRGSRWFGITVVSLVIVMLTMMAIAGSVLTLRHVRRNREVDALFLQLRIRDGLLTYESLAALPIALTAHLPRAPWSPAVVEITGCVPTPELRDGVVRLAMRELSRRRTGVRTAARIAVDPLICPRRASGARGAAPAVTPQGMVPHVLIADDDQPSLNGLEALLTRGGCQVETATDGQMVLEKALAFHPSLVITNFTMPRLNGLEVLEVLRRDCPETP